MERKTVLTRRNTPAPATRDSGRQLVLGDLLRDIATNISSTGDRDFFPSLVQYLARALNLAYAVVGEVVDADEPAVRTLAWCADGAVRPNIEYKLAGTPCADITRRGVCAYPQGVRALFPDDPDLVTLNVESYVGAPLFGSRGQCIGLLTVMDRAPLGNTATVEILLQILAVHAAAELERRRTVHAFEESQRTLTTLMRNLPGMVYRCRNDRDWTMEFASEGARPLTGYAPDDLVSGAVTYGALIHVEDRDGVWNDVQAAVRAHRPFQLLYRIHDAHGRQKWVWEQGQGVYVGGALSHLEGFIIDITERKQAEEALRASEERFKSLTELSSDWYWEQDADLRFTIITRNATAAMRFPPEQSIGKQRWELPYIDVTDDEWEKHKAVLAARQPFKNLVLKRRDAEGNVRYSSMSGVPIFDRDRNFRGYRGIGRDITGRMQAIEALRASEERLRTVLGSAPIVLWATDKSGVITLSEGKALEALGAKPADALGQSLFDLYRDYPDVTEAARRALAGENVVALARIGTRAYEVHFSPAFDAGNQVNGLIGVALDITFRHAAEAEMQKLSSAVQQTADCVMITDKNGVIEYVNHAFETTTGYSRDEALGKKPSIIRSGIQGGEFFRRLWQTILAGDTFCEVFVNRKKDGQLYYEEKTITPLKSAHGEITHFIATGKDISERMQAQERLQYLAHHDALTGLPNRVLFLDRLNQSLIRARWNQRVVAVLFLDLDRFKNINDTLGHDTGDRCLQGMAVRLQECVRTGDTVARLGGDEFAILLEDIAAAEDVSHVAAKILAAFARVFEIAGREFYVTASIGISLYPNDGNDAQALVKNADAAMYRAKDLGKNTYQFYSADMSAHAFERLTLETSLRHALERNEFVLHYQPQIALDSGAVVSVEALLRWQHPEFGLLGPAQFISVAEETGMIVPIGEWVVQTACAQVKAWESAGLGKLRVAVNVSARQFNEPTFVDTILRLLETTRFDASRLEIEITESVIMKNAHVTIERLRVLHAMGVRFAVDDFGTGYSSLSYLRRFAVHTLKIDQSFTREVIGDQGNAEIVKTIIAMAHGLKLTVIAEGVETREQLLFLRSHGCDAVQGYLSSRPMPADQAARVIAERPYLNWLG